MQDSIRVVVVDDQNISRSFFELYVRSSKRYELVSALPSAEMAIDLLDREPVDLLILDVLMRWGVDGLTAAERIKKDHPEVKIILTTSTSETSWEEIAKACGVESFWYKEYNEHSLLEIMEEKQATVRQLLKMGGFSLESIAEITRLQVEEVRAIAESDGR